MENINTTTNANTSQGTTPVVTLTEPTIPKQTTSTQKSYIWHTVVLAGIGGCITSLMVQVFDECEPIFADPGSFFEALLYSFIPVVGSLVTASIIALFFKKTYDKWTWKSPYGYSVIGIFLLGAWYFFYQAQVCTEKFCDMFNLMFMESCLGIASITAFIYVVGMIGKKWNVNFSKVIVCFELILILFALFFLMDGYSLLCDSFIGNLF